MQPDVTDLDHLPQVISHALAPSLLLDAVAGSEHHALRLDPPHAT